MGTILDRDYISCCTREDVDDIPQPPYTHQCGCPQVAIFCESISKTARLCGLPQYTDSSNGIDLIAPPIAFKKREVTLTDFTYKNQGCGFCDNQQETTAFTAGTASLVDAGLVTTQYVLIPNPPFEDRCESVVTEVEAEASETTYDCSTNTGTSTISLSLNAAIQSVIDSGTVYTDGSPYNGLRRAETTQATGTEGSRTQTALNRRTRRSYSSGTCDDGTPVESYLLTTSTTTLSDEDTEEEALERAIADNQIFCGTVRGVRTTDFEFFVQTSKYAVKATDLMVGAIYTARVFFERRPAIKNPDGTGYVDSEGNPSEWTSEDDEGAEMVDEYIFTATASEQIVPTTGTWEDVDEDEEIDEDTEENEFGDEIGYVEITPLVDLPFVYGWEYRIKSVKIELALTADTS